MLEFQGARMSKDEGRGDLSKLDPQHASALSGRPSAEIFSGAKADVVFWPGDTGCSQRSLTLVSFGAIRYHHYTRRALLARRDSWEQLLFCMLHALHSVGTIMNKYV